MKCLVMMCCPKPDNNKAWNIKPTAISDQTNHNKFFKSVALQHFYAKTQSGYATLCF